MKSKAQKQAEARERNLKHISKYISQALKLTNNRVAQINFVKGKIGIPKKEGSDNLLINRLIEAERATKEAA